VLAAPLSAGIISYDVAIDGAQAGTGSPGTGAAFLALDDVAMTLSVDLAFADLLAPTTNAHIHCCAPPGVSAGVIIPFVPAGFPLGVTAGTFFNTFNLTSTQVSDIQSGLSYINIHTSMFPAGEIRGQIVPEPSTFALMLVVLAAAVAFLRWRRPARLRLD
jgi:hypothetical protein